MRTRSAEMRATMMTAQEAVPYDADPVAREQGSSGRLQYFDMHLGQRFVDTGSMRP
ncbi:hypothetical protein O9K63_10680 [Janibacter cremeus]|uniref:hypothetical protein n=1 Tax=Janibacter cremeus TaxID=1285192 RepID=UPI0023F6AB2E|nr:hypothetical protein [Janibacter cremeus]WEV77057.1 hypothetical protein O9K63_10680 [Janibacter cremeus]